MNKHYPEAVLSLKIDDNESEHADMTAMGLVFAWFTYGDSHFSGWMQPEVAALVVARVNACSGLSTDSLEAGILKDFGSVVKSRDELLEACQFFMEELNSGGLVRDTSKDTGADFTIRMMKLVQKLGQAQSAIANAEKKP